MKLAHLSKFEVRLKNLSTIVGTGGIWGSDPLPGARKEAVIDWEQELRGLEDSEGHTVTHLGGGR